MREDILLRFRDLAWQDQYKIYKVIQGYFIHSGPGSEAWQELQERAECVTAIQEVANHLGMAAGETPGVQEYERARKELGITLSAATIVRRWSVWREVCKAARGEKVAQTARQRAHMRAAVKHRPTGNEEWVAGVREWLIDGAHSPYSNREYDAWAQERYESKSNAPPVVASAAVMAALALPWSMVIKVAKRDLSLANAQAQYLRNLKKQSGDFVSIRAIALILGTSERGATRATERATFPAYAFKVCGSRVWYRTDIEAHHAGKPVPKRTQGELQPQVMSSREIGALLGITQKEMQNGVTSKTSRVPTPAGRVRGYNYWFRVSVEAWLDAQQPAIPPVR